MQRIHENISQGCQENRNENRRRHELLCSRIGLLTDRDRLLMTMYLKNGNSIYQISKLSGVCKSTIARRIKRLIKSLIDGEYILCLKNRQRFSGEELIVIRDYFLASMPMKMIAAKRGYSYYRVRQILIKAKELARQNKN